MTNQFAIGIDPSFSQTGLVLIDESFNSIDHGLVSVSGTHKHRTHEYASELHEILGRFASQVAPYACAIGVEAPLMQQGKGTQMVTAGEIRGAVRIAVGSCFSRQQLKADHLSWFEFPSIIWKKIVFGTTVSLGDSIFKTSSSDEYCRLAKGLFRECCGINVNWKENDLVDAHGIAISAMVTRNMQRSPESWDSVGTHVQECWIDEKLRKRKKIQPKELDHLPEKVRKRILKKF